MNVRIFGQQWWVKASKEGRKTLSALTIAGLLLSTGAPVGFAGWNFAEAAQPVGSTVLFSEDFGSTTNNTLDDFEYNKWNDGHTAWDAAAGSRDDVQAYAGGTFTVRAGDSGAGLLLEGNNGANPDEGAQRDIATKGYSTLYVEYSHAWAGTESSDHLVAQYSLDNGVTFSTIEDITGDIANVPDSEVTHSMISLFTIDNPLRHTKLILRFSIDGSATDDKFAIDDIKVYGDGAPLFYDGFESGDFSSWTSVDVGASVDSDTATTDLNPDFWTDDSMVVGNTGKYARMHGLGSADPDDWFEKAQSTDGLQNLKLRFSHKRGSTAEEASDSLKVYVSTTSVPAWTVVETVPGNADASHSSYLVDLSTYPEVSNSSDFRMRFEWNASAGNEYAFIDDVVIWGEPMPTGSISGYKYDHDENGVEDWTIRLWNGEEWIETETDENGYYTFADLEDGSYTVCEAETDGWTQLWPTVAEESGLCEYGNGYDITITDADDVTDQDFQNGELAKITISKVTNPGYLDLDFAFTTTGEGLTAFTLNADDNDSEMFGDLAPGEYSVTETAVEGFVLTDIYCEGGSVEMDEEIGTVSFDLEYGNHTYCTYTNERLPNLTIVKYGSAGDSIFQIDVTGPSEFSNTFSADVAGDGQDTTANLADEVNPFLDLTPGVYSLSEDLPEGWDGETSVTCYAGDTEVASGETGTNIELGYGDDVMCIFNNTPYSTIVGDKFHDLDGNGDGTTGAGLQDWLITLYKWTDEDTNGEEEGVQPGYVEHDDTSTVEGGGYSFGNILPGSYLICEEDRGGWNQSINMGNSTTCAELDAEEDVADRGYTLVIEGIPADESNLPGETYDGFSFGNWQYGSIAGMKWHDENANGELDGDEEGIADWEITLSGPDSDSTYTVGGSYVFNELQPGTYTMSEVQQGGWVQTYPSTASHAVVVTSGQNVLNVNFGNVEDSTISGDKFNDENGNGEDDDESYAPNSFVFQLYKVEGEAAPVLVETSGSDNEYYFDNLLPGTYMVCEVNADGWMQTYPADNACHTVTVGVNEDATGYDFGNVETIELYGYKFNDLNHDGEWYSDGDYQEELGIEGWNIYATPMTEIVVCVPVEGEDYFDCDDELVEATSTDRSVKTVVTDEEGEYEFGFLPSDQGFWKLTEEQQFGWSQTKPDYYGQEYYIVEVTDEDVEYDGGESVYDNYFNFGNWQWPVIKVLKWNDADSDGSYDEEEGTVADYPIAVARRVALALGEGESLGMDLIETEIVQLSLTGSNGIALIPLDPDWFGGFSGLDEALDDGITVFEGQDGDWQKTFPTLTHNDMINVTWRSGLTPMPLHLDSFFDVFTEAIGVDQIAQQGIVHDNAYESILRFGNHSTAQCSDGIDNDNDGYTDYQEDPDCGNSPEGATESTHTGENNTGGGGGGGGGGMPSLIGVVNGGGQVLGASTFFTPVPGEQCSQFIVGYMGPNRDNDPEQVQRLQQILISEGFNVTVNGEFDDATLDAVKAFQVKYADEILAPWGITQPTGFVYLTTRKKLSELYCSAVGQAFPLTDEEQAIIESFKNGNPLGGMSGSTTGTIRMGTTPDTVPDTDSDQDTTSDESQVGVAGGATEDGGFWKRLRSFFGF